ncbi:ABC transporter permease [Amycolatopsis acidicola]|uniref:ABC transporter permease n=1 Tax=Amycolatopsis acidicola TaxID=2596893 RepID=A0A5N0VEA5_9PSEU|nr:ABC transporter permease [Amycolatopsis acidicola]KAA9164395.1 ABC transporter permease [Amycolatopsis acidicola]
MPDLQQHARTDAAHSTADQTPTANTRARGARRGLGLVERYAVPGLLVVLVIGFSSFPATAAAFPTRTNIQNLFSGQAVLGIAAIAVLIPIIAGKYDLSVGAVLGASSLLGAGLMARNGIPPSAAILIVLAAGIVIGFVNGYVVAYLGVNSLIVTTATATVISGFVLWYSQSQVITGIPLSITDAAIGEWLGVPKLVFGFALIAVLAYLMLRFTPYGRYIYAIGSNSRAAGLVGLNVPRLTCSTLVLSSALAALAGIAQLGLQGSASPQLGPGFTLPALSAVFLGSTTIRPGTFNVAGTVIAVYLVAVIVNGLTLAGASDWVQPAFNGLALLAAVILAAVISRRRARRAPAT